MIVKNLQYWTGVDFDEYLKMPGFSYSGIKNEGKTIQRTAKMNFGVDVHNYILTPEEYNHENSSVVKPLAREIKSSLGSLLKYMKPEVAVTADFISQGFCLKFKGRIDLLIPKRIVLDIKVSEVEDTMSQVKFFGYDFQLSGYCLATGCRSAMIISANPKTLKTKLTNIPISSDWWISKIVTKGDPI